MYEGWGGLASDMGESTISLAAPLSHSYLPRFAHPSFSGLFLPPSLSSLPPKICASGRVEGHERRGGSTADGHTLRPVSGLGRCRLAVLVTPPHWSNPAAAAAAAAAARRGRIPGAEAAELRGAGGARLRRRRSKVLPRGWLDSPLAGEGEFILHFISKAKTLLP